MPEAPVETTFPTEARERIAQYHRDIGEPEADENRFEGVVRDAMAVIEALESDYKALTNTVEFMRDRVRSAIEPR